MDVLKSKLGQVLAIVNGELGVTPVGIKFYDEGQLCGICDGPIVAVVERAFCEICQGEVHFQAWVLSTLNSRK